MLRWPHPVAIVFNSVNPILVDGAAFGDITMLAGFDEDVMVAILNGARVEIDRGEESASSLTLDQPLSANYGHPSRAGNLQPIPVTTAACHTRPFPVLGRDPVRLSRRRWPICSVFSARSLGRKSRIFHAVDFCNWQRVLPPCL